MKVVVIGMGEVGAYVAKTLSGERHEVLAVDIDQERIDLMSERLDVATLKGYGANPRTLALAGVDTADLVVCATDSDEVNLIAALASKQLGAGRAVARLQSGEYEDSAPGEEEKGLQYGMFGIDMVVNSHILVADEMFDIARSHGAIDIHMFANNRIELAEVELPADSAVIGTNLRSLELPEQTRVGAVIRGDKLFIPAGEDSLISGDRVFLFGRTGRMNEVEDLFVHGYSAGKVVIYGGNVLGEHLSRQLAKVGVDVTVLETDRAKAKDLAIRLPRVNVVHGDGTDVEKLREENVDRADLYFAVTEDDENNMMSALLAKRLGTPRVCSVVHRPAYIEIYRELGLDMAISPRQVAADHILHYARPAQIESVIHLGESDAEVLEVVAALDSPITEGPLSKMSLPTGVSIGGVVGINGVTIAQGNTQVEPGDTVVVLALGSRRKAVSKLFKRGMF
ncbi:MAG: Trk system potassium transporter TrkA [Myxococcota bacterium]|nr:Trk system potassium transporter TrkA [Myxococcota bacterium]